MQEGPTPWYLRLEFIIAVSAAAVLFLVIIFIIFAFILLRRKRKVYKYGTLSATTEEKEYMLKTIRIPKTPSDGDLLNVRMILRSTPFSLVKPVYEIGDSPAMKNYYLVKSSGKTQYLMTVVENATKLIVNDKERNAFLKTLRNLKHEFIYPVEFVDYDINKGRAVVIRKLAQKGSLRDFLYKVCSFMKMCNIYTV